MILVFLGQFLLQFLNGLIKGFSLFFTNKFHVKFFLVMFLLFIPLEHGHFMWWQILILIVVCKSRSTFRFLDIEKSALNTWSEGSIVNSVRSLHWVTRVTSALFPQLIMLAFYSSHHDNHTSIIHYMFFPFHHLSETEPKPRFLHLFLERFIFFVFCVHLLREPATRA